MMYKKSYCIPPALALASVLEAPLALMAEVMSAKCCSFTVFYVMGKALSGVLSCMPTGLVQTASNSLSRKSRAVCTFVVNYVP